MLQLINDSLGVSPFYACTIIGVVCLGIAFVSVFMTGKKKVIFTSLNFVSIAFLALLVVESLSTNDAWGSGDEMRRGGGAVGLFVAIFMISSIVRDSFKKSTGNRND